MNNPWQAALNPAIYAAAVIPVCVGTSVAFYETGKFDFFCFVLALVGLVLIQAWINLSNDVFDGETGVDRNKPWSLVSLTGNPQLIFWLGNLFLCLGLVSFSLLAWTLGDGTILAVSALGCFLGYAYQGPPFRLAYQGWGELISFTCFGPIAVTVSTYAQSQQWSGISLAASLVVGALTSCILYAHHFPQIEDDRACGKFTPIVRWGTGDASLRFIWLVLAVYSPVALFTLLQVFPWTSLGVLATFPLAWQVYCWICTYHDQPEQVGQAMPLVIQLHFYSGLILTLTLVVGRWIT